MKVNIQSLQNGVNAFEFDAPVEELLFDSQGLNVNSVAVKSLVDKGEQNIVVSSHIKACVEMTCDSCLEAFDGRVEDSFTILYASEKESLGDDEMTRLLASGTHSIDLTEGVRESMLLSLPMRYKCSDACKGLCDQCGADLNKTACGCTQERVDPRWQGLEKLFGGESGNG